MLGQSPGPLSSAVDVVSPIVYPSDYPPLWDGLEDPGEHPDVVVGGSLDAGMSGVASGGAILRPWLQGFGYTPDQIGAEILEAEERGLGWLLWHPDGEYTVDALLTGAER
jgi:hypothetical protein